MAVLTAHCRQAIICRAYDLGRRTRRHDHVDATEVYGRAFVLIGVATLSHRDAADAYSAPHICDDASAWRMALVRASGEAAGVN